MFKSQWVVLVSLTAMNFVTPPLHAVSEQAHIDLRTRKIAIIRGEIDGSVAKYYERDVLGTMQYPGPRLVLISSIGGSVAAGEKIIKGMEAEKKLGVKQVCFVTDVASSMAFNILTHCDVRLADPSARLMFHKIGVYDVGLLEGRRTAIDLRQMADDLDRDEIPYATANRKALRMSEKDYNLFADNDHTWKPETLLKRKYLHGLGSLSNL